MELQELIHEFEALDLVELQRRKEVLEQELRCLNLAIKFRSINGHGSPVDLFQSLEDWMLKHDLSVRVRRLPDRLGLKTLFELVQKTEREIMCAKNFGMTGLNQLKRALYEDGLSLKT